MSSLKKMVVLLLAVLQLNAEEIYATFDVKAEKSASLAFSSSGIVEQMHVDIGSKVKKDELLAELVNDDIEAMVEVSKVALKYAKSDYEKQKKVLDRP